MIVTYVKSKEEKVAPLNHTLNSRLISTNCCVQTECAMVKYSTSLCFFVGSAANDENLEL